MDASRTRRRAYAVQYICAGHVQYICSRTRRRRSGRHKASNLRRERVTLSPCLSTRNGTQTSTLALVESCRFASSAASSSRRRAKPSRGTPCSRTKPSSSHSAITRSQSSPPSRGCRARASEGRLWAHRGVTDGVNDSVKDGVKEGVKDGGAVAARTAPHGTARHGTAWYDVA